MAAARHVSRSASNSWRARRCRRKAWASRPKVVCPRRRTIGKLR
jgi:hypothetical protein